MLAEHMEKFIAPTVGIVLVTTRASQAVSLGRHSSLLVMTLGKTACSLGLASVSLSQRRNSRRRRRVEQDLHGDETLVQGWCVSFPLEAAEGLMDGISWFLAPVTK